jgi:hypothetical protein
MMMSLIKQKNKDMTLNEFIEQFDTDDSIVLLEGKREVLPSETNSLFQLGKILAAKTGKIKFRSGNALGADYYFSMGVVSVDSTRLEVITPYAKHRQKTNVACETIALDDINIAAEPEVIYQSKANKKTEKLIDLYVSGHKDKYTIKAAYILRDTIKVLGADHIKPANFGIFYDDLNKPKTGGTGHTMSVCERQGIPVIDQKTWFQWLT